MQRLINLPFSRHFTDAHLRSPKNGWGHAHRFSQLALAEQTLR
jgi:ligand-binding SRPBCC domain-containing protein